MEPRRPRPIPEIDSIRFELAEAPAQLGIEPSGDVMHLLEEFDECLDEIAEIKHTFGCVGLALYSANLFEVTMRSLLWFESRITGNPARRVKIQTEWEELYVELGTKSCGQLLKRLAARINLNDHAESLLQRSLDKRNELAHNFFYEKSAEFVSTTGRRVMIKEIASMIDLFKAAEATTQVLLDSLTSQAGLDREWIDQQMAEEFQKVLDSSEAT